MTVTRFAILVSITVAVALTGCSLTGDVSFKPAGTAPALSKQASLLQELSKKRELSTREYRATIDCLESDAGFGWKFTWSVMSYLSAGASGILAAASPANTAAAGLAGLFSGTFKAIDDANTSKRHMIVLTEQFTQESKKFESNREKLIKSVNEDEAESVYQLAFAALDDIQTASIQYRADSCAGPNKGVAGAN